ncbi:MAG: hypothetical protein P1U61_03370 [Legionellaceae bacterium]|nr:hypothetical protein [Legionellaceae bacterium]
MKRILFCIASLCFSSGLFAASCLKAMPTDSSKFCSSFKVAAQCHCSASGLPVTMCNNVRLLYQRLMVTFGTIEKTCAFQHDTSKEDCIDSWKCYLNGGKNSQGKLCNSTGRSCP